MYPVSAAYRAAVRRDHSISSRVEVWRDGSPVLTLEPTAGGVEVDARRGVRRTLDLTVPVPEATLEPTSSPPTYGEIAGTLTGSWARTNLVECPSGETGAVAGGASSGCTVATSSAESLYGSGSLKFTYGGGATPFFHALSAATLRTPVTALATYTFSVYLKDASAARNLYLRIEWYTAALGYISTTTGSAVGITTSGWTRLTLTGTAPATAARATPIVVASGTPTATHATYLDGALFEEAASAGTYFDGTTGGVVRWNGTTGNSTSSLYTPDTGTYYRLGQDSPTYGALAQPISRDLVSVESRLVPATAYDPVAPYGNEIRAWRGVTVTSRRRSTYAGLAAAGYADYSALDAGVANYGAFTLPTVEETAVEEVPLGVYVITDVEVRGSRGSTSLAVKASDRSVRIQRNRWTQPYTIAAGTNVGTAILGILTDRWPAVVTAFTATAATVPLTVLGLEPDNDPWSDAQALASSAGLDLYFDADGAARLEPVPDYTDASPDAIYRENAEAMVLNLSRSISVQRTYNGVIVTAEGSGVDDVYRAEAWDDDASSPTYRYGPFGAVPRFFSSPLITSQAAADATAAAFLSRSRGSVEGVEWEQITDGALDAGDVIAVVNEATRIDRLMVLDRLSIPLGLGTMKAISRTVRSLSGTGFADEE